jgi:hypothetical protein
MPRGRSPELVLDCPRFFPPPPSPLAPRAGERAAKFRAQLSGGAPSLVEGADGKLRQPPSAPQRTAPPPPSGPSGLWAPPPAPRPASTPTLASPPSLSVAPPTLHAAYHTPAEPAAPAPPGLGLMGSGADASPAATPSLSSTSAASHFAADWDPFGTGLGSVSVSAAAGPSLGQPQALGGAAQAGRSWEVFEGGAATAGAQGHES